MRFPGAAPSEPTLGRIAWFRNRRRITLPELKAATQRFRRKGPLVRTLVNPAAAATAAKETSLPLEASKQPFAAPRVTTSRRAERICGGHEHCAMMPCLSRGLWLGLVWRMCYANEVTLA